MSCVVCHERRDLIGFACSECLQELEPAMAITPEQVRMRGETSGRAVLIDQWGRAHRLHTQTVVGRELDGDGLLILDANTSRRHAMIEQIGDTYVLTDLSSVNGTVVDSLPVTGAAALRDGERITFGRVKLYFLEDIGAAPWPDPGTLSGHTVRTVERPPTIDKAPARLRTIVLREPTGGGGGVLVVDGRAIQLPLAQFELMSILWNRARVDQTASVVSDTGGFVHPSELVRQLSLESLEPTEDHVRQLVRRARRALFKAGIENLIESRYGAGYRLAVAAPVLG